MVERRKQEARAGRELRIDTNHAEMLSPAEMVQNPTNFMYLESMARTMMDAGEIDEASWAGVSSKLLKAAQTGGQDGLPKIGDRENPDGPAEIRTWRTVMGRFMKGRELATEFDREFSSEQLNTLLLWTAEHQRINSGAGGGLDLHNIIASMLGARQEFVPQLLKTIAYVDARAFRNTVTALNNLRHIEKEDRSVENSLRQFAVDNTLDQDEVLRIALESNDWKAELTQLAARNARGGTQRNTWSTALGGISRITASLSSNLSSLENLFRSVAQYRNRTPLRDEYMGNLTGALLATVNGPAAGSITGTLNQLALHPSARPETVAAYETLERTKHTLETRTTDDAQVTNGITRINAERARRSQPPLDLTTPIGCQDAARELLNTQGQSLLESSSTDQNGFFATMWKMMSNFVGVLFNTQQVNALGDRLGRLHAAPGSTI